MRLTRTLLPLLAFAQSLTGCGSLASPSQVPQPTRLAAFVDRESGFGTTDVRDVNDQILRFNTQGELIWAADGERFPGYLADGHVITAERICQACYFLVRFGTRNGELRAYLTWSGDESNDHPATVLDVDVVDGRLVVSNTDIPVPKT